MAGRLNLNVVVAGAGVVGSVVALELARAGARVALVDPGPEGANASAVAAGMLAPAFESLLEGPLTDYRLLRQARDLWPALAQSLGVTLQKPGALGLGKARQLDQWEASLEDLGVLTLRYSADQISALWPWLHAADGGLWCGEDWRLESGPALALIHTAGQAAGVHTHCGKVVDFVRGTAHLECGTALAADALVIATGASTSLLELAANLSVMTPIKGHILRLPAWKKPGPVLRWRGGYVCPSQDGAIIGATMEVGGQNLSIDDEIVGRLQAAAVVAIPAFAKHEVTAATGVRASTPDGLPLVGPASTPGVWLAVGARRNGWLLAPLIAQTLLSRMLGGLCSGVPDAADHLFDAARFSPPA